MRKQVAYGKVLFAVLRELRDVFGHWVIQSYFAPLHQLHYRSRRGHYLRQRGDVKDGIRSHGLAPRLERAVAEGLPVHHLAVVPDQQHRAGNLPVVDGFLNNGVEDAKAARRTGFGRSQRRRGKHAYCNRSHQKARRERLHRNLCPLVFL